MPYIDPDEQRRYQKEWRARRRAAFFSDKVCAECGSTENLELDHVDPSKKVAHNIWSWSADRQAAEIAKCQVLCEKCHMTKTLAERKPTEHGKAWMYQGHKCRCDLCLEWKRTSDAYYRQKRRDNLLEASPNGMAAGC